MARRHSELVLAAVVFVAWPREARADAEGELQQARTEFVAGTENVKNARWGEALGAFERSAALRPHALTTYNIGACERALGRYTRAQVSLRRALEADSAAEHKELPKSFADDARRWIVELDRLIAKVALTLAPADATLLVDGSALSRNGATYVAGLPADGVVDRRGGESKGAMNVVIDPGEHLFTISRAGFVTTILRKQFAPGSKTTLALDLKSMPAEIRVAANVKNAVVSVDDLDSGYAPVELTRPAGTYHVAVRKLGYVSYQTTVKVNGGEHPSLLANLSVESKPVYKKWWFWSAAAVVVAGAAVSTYFLARPAETRPAADGGGLGWVVSVPAAR